MVRAGVCKTLGWRVRFPLLPYIRGIMSHPYRDINNYLDSPNDPFLKIPIYGPTKEMVSYSPFDISKLDKGYVFDDYLTYTGYSKYASSTRMLFSGKLYKKYIMSIKDFDKLKIIQNMVHGTVSGKWKFIKKGSTYFLTLVEFT